MTGRREGHLHRWPQIWHKNRQQSSSLRYEDTVPDVFYPVECDKGHTQWWANNKPLQCSLDTDYDINKRKTYRV